MKASEKAYTAGIVDGEGSVSIYQSNGYLMLRVGVVQREDRVAMLSWLEERWGGTIAKHQEHTLQWTARASEAKRLLLKILPFLIIKKPQARLAIAFQLLKDSSRRLRVPNPHGKGVCLPLAVLDICDEVKTMFNALNSRYPNITSVAETERESLITRVRLLVRGDENATVHPRQIVNA